jgi:hypothetical protein
LVRLIGDGQLPPELNGVNWGAFWLTWLWALFNGLWEWVLIILASVFALEQVASGVAYSIGGLNAVGWFIFADRIFSGVFGAASAVVFGVWGNRLVWWRERRRIAASGGNPRRPKTLEHYVSAQKGWTIAGFILGGLSAVGAVLILARTPAVVGFSTRLGEACFVVAIGVVAVVAAVQARRSRAGKLTTAST